MFDFDPKHLPGRFVETPVVDGTVRAFALPPLPLVPMTANRLIQQTALSTPTVKASLADLDRLGIVQESTGLTRDQVFSYRRNLAVPSEGTDRLPATA